VQERVDMTGALTLSLIDRDGRVVWRAQRGNRIVKSGRRLVAELFAGGQSGAKPARVTHIGVGTGGAPATDDDVGLGEPRGDRKPISDVTFTDIEERDGQNTVKRTRVALTAVFDYEDANGRAPLQEAGIFTAVNEGVMYNRVVFEPVTKTKAFKLTLLWDVVF